MGWQDWNTDSRSRMTWTSAFCNCTLTSCMPRSSPTLECVDGRAGRKPANGKPMAGAELRLESFSFYSYPTRIFFSAAYGFDRFDHFVPEFEHVRHVRKRGRCSTSECFSASILTDYREGCKYVAVSDDGRVCPWYSFSPPCARRRSLRSFFCPPQQRGELRTSGDARIDLLGMPDLNGALPAQQVSSAVDEAARRKSPWLAAGMSILVPGAGEFYAGDYWKSAAFFAVDVALWIFAYNYDKKGDRQTDFFQKLRQPKLGVVKYAQYAQDNLTHRTVRTQMADSEHRRAPAVGSCQLERTQQDGTGYRRVLFSFLPPYGQQHTTS